MQFRSISIIRAPYLQEAQQRVLTSKAQLGLSTHTVDNVANLSSPVGDGFCRSLLFFTGVCTGFKHLKEIIKKSGHGTKMSGRA